MRVKYEFVTRDGSQAFSVFEKEMAKVLKEAKKAQVSLEIKSKEFARKSADYMAYRINSITKRKNNSTGELVDSIYQSIHFRRSSSKGFTITLGGPELVDYWAMINYGGFITSGWVPGYWNTDGTFTYEHHEKGDKNTGYMYPNKAIKGFHYILYAYARMIEYVNRSFDIFK